MNESLKVGDVLSGSWGYEQTNVTFAKVLQVRPSMVQIQQVEKKILPGSSGGSMAGVAVPDPDALLGKPVWRKLGNGVNWNGHCTLSLWDGKPEFTSWYG